MGDTMEVCSLSPHMAGPCTSLAHIHREPRGSLRRTIMEALSPRRSSLTPVFPMNTGVLFYSDAMINERSINWISEDAHVDALGRV
jgi:hypothetical protein